MPADAAFTIREATWRDLFPVQDLEHECFREDAWALIEMLGVLTFPGVVRYKAVGTGGELAGFIAGDARAKDGCGWIMTVAVIPAFRRMGVARALMAACESAMRLPLVKLTVRPSNLEAVALYEKLGYTRHETWPKYYHDGEDGLVMQREIQRPSGEGA